MTEFKFELGQKVLFDSQSGEILGRAEYKDGFHCPSYFVRFKGDDGKHTDQWINENDLISR